MPGMLIWRVSAEWASASPRPRWCARVIAGNIAFFSATRVAIRNGGVYSQVSYFRNGKIASNLIPYGKPNLIVGIDALEAVRGLDPKNIHEWEAPQFTTAILNTEKTPTILTLLGRDDFDPSDSGGHHRCYTNPEKYFSFNVSHLSEKYFGANFCEHFASGSLISRGCSQAGKLSSGPSSKPRDPPQRKTQRCFSLDASWSLIHPLSARTDIRPLSRFGGSQGQLSLAFPSAHVAPPMPIVT